MKDYIEEEPKLTEARSPEPLNYAIQSYKSESNECQDLNEDDNFVIVSKYLNFALLVKRPAGVHSLRYILSNDSLYGISHRAITCGADNDIGFQKVAIGKYEPVRLNLCNLLPLLNLDLSICD